jgi:hypothetical protein
LRFWWKNVQQKKKVRVYYCELYEAGGTLERRRHRCPRGTVFFHPYFPGFSVVPCHFSSRFTKNSEVFCNPAFHGRDSERGDDKRAAVRLQKMQRRFHNTLPGQSGGFCSGQPTTKKVEKREHKKRLSRSRPPARRFGNGDDRIANSWYGFRRYGDGDDVRRLIVFCRNLWVLYVVAAAICHRRCTHFVGTTCAFSTRGVIFACDTCALLQFR